MVQLDGFSGVLPDCPVESYLGKAPLLVQYIAPEQGCLFEAGQQYGSSPWILGKTRNTPDSGQLLKCSRYWLAMVTDGAMGLINVAIVLRGNSWVVPGWMGDIGVVTSYCPFSVAIYHSLKIGNNRGSLIPLLEPPRKG